MLFLFCPICIIPKIALGSRRNMTQRQTFPLKTELPSLNSLEKFQLHVSVSKCVIWSCPIVRKTPSKSPWLLQQTSWVRQVRPRVQDLVLLGCYCIQESRMWDLPWPFALKQEAGTLQEDILHRQWVQTRSPAQAVSSGTASCVLWAARQGSLSLAEWERAGAPWCWQPQLGVSILQGCSNSFRHSHWREKPRAQDLETEFRLSRFSESKSF